MRTDPVHWVSKYQWPAPIPCPLYLSASQWPASCVFARWERCVSSLSPGGSSRSTTYRSGFQHHEVNDRPPRRRTHYVGSRRPHFFAIRQGCCSVHSGVGMGTILPIPFVVWFLSLAHPHFQSYNSDDQNPCDIAGWLDSACTGNRESSIPPAPANCPLINISKQPYNSPTYPTIPTTSLPRRITMR